MKPTTKQKAAAWCRAAQLLVDVVAPRIVSGEADAIEHHIFDAIVPSLEQRARIIARRKRT